MNPRNQHRVVPDRADHSYGGEPDELYADFEEQSEPSAVCPAVGGFFELATVPRRPAAAQEVEQMASNRNRPLCAARHHPVRRYAPGPEPRSGWSGRPRSPHTPWAAFCPAAFPARRRRERTRKTAWLRINTST